MDIKLIEEGISKIIEGLGEDVNRKDLQKTPKRFSGMCREIFSGYEAAPPGLSILEGPSSNSAVVLRHMKYYSMCEHHFLPFFGEMNLVYLPDNDKITGFSEIVEVIEYFSHRLQIQERLTAQIAEYIFEKLQPKGLLLHSDAIQLCMSMRGVKSGNARTEVVSAFGIYESDRKLKQEAMSLILSR